MPRRVALLFFMRALPGLAVILAASCAGGARDDHRVKGILFDLWRNVERGAVATLTHLPAYPSTPNQSRIVK